MKAVSYKKYGSPDVIEIKEVDKPVPGEDDILVRIRGTVVSPPDCAERMGKPFIVRFFSGFFRPKSIPGDAFAGEIVDLGKNVTTYKIGDRIYGASDAKGGAHAEFKVISRYGSIANIPQGMSYGDAAAISEGVLTALPFIRDNGKISKGKSILINGASGSVGSDAIQLARYYGAEVTGVCSTKNVELVKSLGADHVIDYTKEDFTNNGKTYDIIFDAIGKSSYGKSKRALKSNGIYLTTVPSFAIMFQMIGTTKSQKKKAIFAATGLRPADAKIIDLHFLNKLIEENTIKPVIDKTYTLDKIAEAHAYVDTGRKVGNVIINI